MRIDKFLWSARLLKTRALAKEACDRGHVRLGDREAKAGVEVKVGDLFSIRVPPIRRSYRVKSIPPSRVAAKLVPDLIEEITPWEELEKAELARKVQADSRDPGAGRPTKRERRDIERWTGDGS